MSKELIEEMENNSSRLRDLGKKTKMELAVMLLTAEIRIEQLEKNASGKHYMKYCYDCNKIIE